MAKKRIKKRAKIKVEKVDGLGPENVKRIRAAIRMVWHWSHAKRLATARATGKDGFAYCERCKKKAPKVFIDHKKQVGDVDAGFIARLFCPSSGLQALCKTCHDAKTKAERKVAAAIERAKRAGPIGGGRFAARNRPNPPCDDFF